MSELLAKTFFFYSQLLVRRLKMIACISHHPPPLPNLSIFIQKFECVLYARGIFLSRLCALFPSPHSVHNTAGKTGTQNCDPQDGVQLKVGLSLKNVNQAASPPNSHSHANVCCIWVSPTLYLKMGITFSENVFLGLIHLFPLRSES